MSDVLLLNATYEPLSVLSVRRAAKLLLNERVEPVAEEGLSLVSQKQTLKVPSVLRLRIYVDVPRRKPPAWTWRGLLARDHYACAYCGKKCTLADATVDHVLPVSRGGRSSWGNTVTACWKCNQRKANCTPHEAGMKLLIEPRLPRTRYVSASGEVPSAWQLWLEF